MTIFWIPVWSLGRYRIIDLGSALSRRGSEYVGRRFPVSAGNPWGDKRLSKNLAMVDHLTGRYQKDWPGPPPSRLPEHPEARGSAYEEAEVMWAAGRASEAVPLYEAVLARHEAVLAVDDTATLQIRQRVGEAYLAAGRVVDAYAMLEQTSHHLARVLGPGHPETTRAQEAVAEAGSRMGPGGIYDADVMLQRKLDALEKSVGLDDLEALRVASALGSALQLNDVIRGIELLERTLERSARVRCAQHPDTIEVRGALIWLCDVAEVGRERPARRAAAGARKRLNDYDASPTGDR
ncbi:tetratricopeptide repeat protein [Promicromonospora sp. NPDC023987]|uniref:tetratricopeptide repeat protein n=1 Tax=Promicromonospora sp. NPDC023987 TaxID=3155360 RepID=UPI0033CC0727